MGREKFLEGLGISDARIEVVRPPELPEKREQAAMESVAPPTLPPIETEEEMLDEQVSELKGQVKELEVKLDQLDEIITVEKEKQEDQAEIDATKCPECRNTVGWNNLPAEGLPFPFSLFTQAYGKRCPVCKYFKEAEED